MLLRHATAGGRVFAVWQPILPTDWSAPTSSVLNRLSDKRVQQYWDPSHLLAKRMQEDAKAPQPEQECCVRSGILWDLAALYPKGTSWTDRMPPAVVFNGPVVNVVPEIESSLSSTARHIVPDQGSFDRTAAVAYTRVCASLGCDPVRDGLGLSVRPSLGAAHPRVRRSRSSRAPSRARCTRAPAVSAASGP